LKFLLRTIINLFYLFHIGLWSIGNATPSDLFIANNTDRIGFEIDGRVVSWETRVSERWIDVLQRSNMPLFALDVEYKGKAITPQIHWSLGDSTGSSLSFVGVYEASSLWLLRRYLMAGDGLPITMTVQLNWDKADIASEHAANISIGSGLYHHAPNDGSLGDFFYGYDRQIILKNKEHDSIVYGGSLVARHVAVVTELSSTPENVAAIPISGGDLRLPITVADKKAAQSASSARVAVEYEVSAITLLGSRVEGRRYEYLMFDGLWSPLKSLGFLIERFLLSVSGLTGSLGFAMVYLALVVRLVTLPISIWSAIQQRKFTAIQARMASEIDQFKQRYKGAEQSEAILETYKKYGVSPWSGLKGSMALLVQLPILVTVFTVTTESAIFREIPFWWFNDLSLPDRSLAFPLSIPGVGRYLNVLPLILGLINIYSMRRQRRNNPDSAEGANRISLFLTLLIVFFFYSFSAALVLYWIVVNLVQILESEYVAARFSHEPVSVD